MSCTFLDSGKETENPEKNLQTQEYYNANSLTLR